MLPPPPKEVMGLERGRSLRARSKASVCTRQRNGRAQSRGGIGELPESLELPRVVASRASLA